MSKDILVSHLCPHVIRNEKYELDNTRELVTRNPITGDSFLIIKREGISIPPSGLKTYPEIVFPSNAPYRNLSVLDIIITNYKGVEYTISVPKGILSQKQVVDLFNSKLPNTIRATAKDKSVAITEIFESGRLCSLKISGEDLKPFGFKTNIFISRGKDIFSGWKISARSDIGYKIVFDKPITSTLELDYMTKKEYCTRCATTGVENDLRFDNTGSMVMVEGYDKLYQTIAKICLTRVNSNPYHSWYGTNAFDLIGNKLQSATEMSLRDSVSKAITKIVDVQNQLEKLQSLTLEERISRVRRITVEPLDQDQTTYLVTVEVVSRANTSVNINIVFAVPGSFDITGA
jgi:hypothetical protein